LAAMLAAITTNSASLVWVMRPPTAYKIAETIGGTAAADVPRTLFGIPLVLSANSPQQVTLIDASHVLYSDDGAIELDTTDEATIQMNDAPTDPAVAATVFQSLWRRAMTFPTVDELLDALEQLATDRQREIMTDLLVDPADVPEDLFDAMQVPDGQMETWRIQTRRQLAALPFTFPLHVDFQTRKP
jgi:hypothetical protein